MRKESYFMISMFIWMSFLPSSSGNYSVRQRIFFFRKAVEQKSESLGSLDATHRDPVGATHSVTHSEATQHSRPMARRQPGSTSRASGLRSPWANWTGVSCGAKQKGHVGISGIRPLKNSNISNISTLACFEGEQASGSKMDAHLKWWRM